MAEQQDFSCPDRYESGTETVSRPFDGGQSQADEESEFKGGELSYRRNQREHRLTSVASQYQEERVKKAESGFYRAYKAFKSQLLLTREEIKRSCDEEELRGLQQDLERKHQQVTRAYEILRNFMSVIDNFPILQKKDGHVIRL